MINGLKNKELVLKILSDGRPHFSREFVDAGLLEYRKRIMELRVSGKNIQRVKIQTTMGGLRPGYQLAGIQRDLF